MLDKLLGKASKSMLAAGTHGRSIHSIDLNAVTGVPDEGDGLHSVVSLSNHPNPFGRVTTIAFSLSRPSNVTLAIYDIAGHKVRTLEKGNRTAGDHEIRWDGRNQAGRTVANGTYFLRLEAGGEVAAVKMNVVR